MCMSNDVEMEVNMEDADADDVEVLVAVTVLGTRSSETTLEGWMNLC